MILEQLKVCSFFKYIFITGGAYYKEIILHIYLAQSYLDVHSRTLTKKIVIVILFKSIVDFPQPKEVR